jgi:putative FmdB family regulatory protein
MPLYEYRCDKGHAFEVLQRMSDDPVAECERCGAPVNRVFHPVAVHFKGSGFYTTDYGRGKRAAGSDDSAGGDSPAKKSDSGGDKKPEKSGSAGKSDSGSGD